MKNKTKAGKIILIIFAVFAVISIYALMIYLGSKDNKKEYTVMSVNTKIVTREYGTPQLYLFVEYWDDEKNKYIEVNKNYNTCTELEKYIVTNIENYSHGEICVVVHDYVMKAVIIPEYGNFQLFIEEVSSE